MTKLRALAVLLVLAAVLSWPCRRQMGVKGVELSVSFSNRVLTDNLFTDVTYRFRTTSSFAPLAEDSRVVSRFTQRGKLLFLDEYEPPIPTSKWEAGKEYAFTRRIYIPVVIDEFDPGFKGAETLGFEVGLASSAAGAGQAGIVFLKRTLRLVPSVGSPVIVYLGGWYPSEAGPGEPAPRWRWTAREARCAIDKPGRDALLVIRGEVDPAAPAGQKVTISIAGRVLEEFAPGPGRFERSFKISKEWAGDGRDFVLAIAVDPTFVPAKVTPGSEDTRELGVRISLVYFR
jgi:hypothetical protein